MNNKPQTTRSSPRAELRCRFAPEAAGKRWRRSRRVSTGAARWALYVWMLAGVALAGSRVKESKRVTPFPASGGGGANAALDVLVEGSVKYDGVGLGRIDFNITKPGVRTNNTVVTIKVYTPKGVPIWRTEVEMLPWQLYGTASCRLLPLATPGRYTYQYWTKRQPVHKGQVDYAPRLRMQYVKTSRNGKVNLIMFPRKGYTEADLTKWESAGDHALRQAFFWEPLKDGEQRVYKLTTRQHTTVTFRLPGLYVIDVFPDSTVFIVEQRDKSVPLIGYRYTFNCVKGLYWVRREQIGNPPGAAFNLSHSLRPPYERWVIWAAGEIAGMDQGFGYETGAAFAGDAIGEYLEEVTGIWKIGWLISGPFPWQVTAVETGAGLLWGTHLFENLLSAYGTLYAAPRSAAIRSRAKFTADPDTHMQEPQKYAARLMFHLVKNVNQADYTPSYHRAMEAFEWGYQLAWLYGALYIPGDPARSALSREQAPPELLTLMGALSFRAKLGKGSVLRGDLVWSPRGTDWGGTVLGRYALVASNTVWVMNEDGTDCRQVAAAAADQTVAQLAWSKDATRLAYTAWRTDTDGNPMHGEVWTVKADGTDHRCLIAGDPPATNAMEDADHPWTVFTRDYFAGPDFSPDGSQVSVQRYRTYEDRDTNASLRYCYMDRLTCEDVETCLLPTAGGTPTTVPGSEWSRYQPRGANRLIGPSECQAPFSFSTAWSAQDELLWPRSFEPQMSGISVTPNGGFADLTPFTFQFIYWDSYNDPPRGAWFYLNGTYHPMAFAGFVHPSSGAWGDYRHGAIYVCTNTLPANGTLPQSNEWFVVQTSNGQWISSWVSLNQWPVRYGLSNVKATLVDSNNATAWGQYGYEFTADYVDLDNRGDPLVLIEAPGAAGLFVAPMRSAGGNTRKAHVTLPLAYAPGATTTNAVRYWILPCADPGGAAGPYTLNITHTWPAKPWLSATGGVYVTASLSKSVTYTQDIDGDGSNEVVTITVDGGISATRGRSADTFLYRARYHNSHNLPATRAGVVIDGGEHAMTYVGSEGSTKVYEYETTLAANASPHQWQLYFADAHADCQTDTANEPWVADAALSHPTNFLNGNREFTFRVQAHQDAGTGTVYCVITTPQGLPRFIQPMTRVSGSLETSATYELTAKPDTAMHIASKEDGNLMRGGANLPALGLVSFGYSFYLLDDFDRCGSRLAPMSAWSGAATSKRSYSCYIRHDDYNTWHRMLVLNKAGDHVQRSPPGRGTVHSVHGLGCARGGLAWSQDGSTLAVCGGTNFSQTLTLFTNQGAGVYTLLAAATNGAYAALSGWRTAESVYVARDPDASPDGPWEFGEYDWQSGLFLHNNAVGEPLPAAGKCPFMAGRFSSCYDPLNAWVVATPITWAQAVCAEGEVEFGESNGVLVTVGPREQSRFDAARGDAQPQPPQPAAIPLTAERLAEGPCAADDPLDGNVGWHSSETLLSAGSPGQIGFPEFMGQVDTATPTFSFAFSGQPDPSSADGLFFSLSREDETLIFADTLGGLAASGHVSYAVNQSNLTVTVQRPLDPGMYWAELRLGGLALAGGDTTPAGTASGWLAVTGGLSQAGGVVELLDSHVRVMAPPNTFSRPVVVDMAMPVDELGESPPEHTLLRPPLAVSWTPDDPPANPLVLMFDLRGSEGLAGAEPAVGVWDGEAWQIHDAQLADNGLQVAYPFTQDGIYGLFCRPRAAPDLRAWTVIPQNTTAPGEEVPVGVEIRQVAGGMATNARVRLLIAPDAEYVPGSASNGGIYDADSRAVEWHWTNLFVGGQRSTTCRVRAGITNATLDLQVCVSASNLTERRFACEPVTITTQVTVEISASLAEAVCTVTGPELVRVGTGVLWRLENQMPGFYQAVFVPVPEYGLAGNTYTQTCVAAAGQTVHFRAVFFPDRDQDGLPDAWELERAPDLETFTGADSDGDGMPDDDERQAFTDPLDPESLLTIAAVSAATGETAEGAVISWCSEDGVRYRIVRATNLTEYSPFTWTVASNIVGIAPMNTETDTTAVGQGPYFYRIGLE